MTTTNNSNSLTINKNYGPLFGLPDGSEMIYAGGDDWVARQGGRIMKKTCPKTTAKVAAALAKGTMMGKMG